MKKKEQKKYFDKEWRAMKASLRCYLKTEQHEDLHDFRVQVKKLRAFVILSDSARKHGRLAKPFQQVRKIFKHAGEIRNAHLNIGLAEQHHTKHETAVLNDRQLLEKAVKVFVSKRDSHFKKVNAAHRLVKKQIQPISNLHINLFCINLLHQLADLFAKLETDDQLHECRKLIKILAYNYKLIRPALKVQINSDYLEQMQTAIGDWHDQVVAIEQFGAGEVNAAQIEQLKKNSETLKSEIRELAADFFNKATTMVELSIEQVD